MSLPLSAAMGHAFDYRALLYHLHPQEFSAVDLGGGVSGVGSELASDGFHLTFLLGVLAPLV
jgi:hypothetical protein